MRLSFLITKCLLEGDLASHFAKVPSAEGDAEPIVLREGAFEREARLPDGERGTVPVDVLVVREVGADAEAVAIACERWVRSWPWERNAEEWPWRVVGIDTSAPRFKERDSSGRYVWGFVVTVTVVRGA